MVVCARARVRACEKPFISLPPRQVSPSEQQLAFFVATVAEWGCSGLKPESCSGLQNHLQVESE